MIPVREIQHTLERSLSRARYRHSLAVADLARLLARRHDVNPDQAYRAGLVHDCAKEFSPKKLQQLVKKNKLNVPDTAFISKHAPNLFHAYAGAQVAKERGWIRGRALYDAVARHTLGDVRMSTLDQIIYVADFASKDRAHSSATEVRALAKKNLRKGFIMALAKKMEWNLLSRKPIHPHALKVWNAHLNHH